MGFEWFKFSPVHWAMGRIQRMTHEQKGEFIDFCSQYWTKQGEISYEDAKYDCPIIDDFIKSGVIKKEDNNIFIDFLDEQLEHTKQVSKRRSKAGKAGANAKQMLASAKQTQADKNRQDKNRQDKTRTDSVDIPSFEVFKSHAEEKDFYDPLMENDLRRKYENWKDSDWQDGYGNPIKNWKIKLNNTIPHLKKTKPVLNYSGGFIEGAM